MARLINVQSKVLLGRYSFHIFDQWKNQKYGSWAFSFMEFGFVNYNIQKGATVRIKILGLCTEVFIDYGPLTSPDDVPF